MAQSPDTIYKEQFDTFYGGIPDDMRSAGNGYGIAQHFDIFTNTKRISPYRNMVDDMGGNEAYTIINFLYANSKTYGQGVVSGSGKNKIYEKSSDAITGSWGASSSGESSGGARNEHLFSEFHNYIYTAAAGSNRIQYYGDITGTPSFNETAFSLTNLPTAPGLITGDDILIVPCRNIIVKKDGAGSGPTDAWSEALTLPSDRNCVDRCEYQDLVALATAPISGYGGSKNSIVYLWDKYSTDPKQRIDFGEGSIVLIEEIEGELVGIINVGGSTSFGIKPRLVIRKWSGGSKANVYKEIQADSGTTLTIYDARVKARDGNKLIFGAKITIDGTTYDQLFAFGRKNANYPQALTLDRKIDNDNALTSGIQSIGKLGDYFFAAHNSDGSVNRTNDQNAYGADATLNTSTFQTPRFNGENKVQDAARRYKVLTMAGVVCKALTSGQSISLYFRKDGDSSWSLVRTYSYGDDTAGMGFEAGKMNDATDFANYKEGQFKATSNAGAVVYEIVYAWKLAGADVISGD